MLVEYIFVQFILVFKIFVQFIFDLNSTNPTGPRRTSAAGAEAVSPVGQLKSTWDSDKLVMETGRPRRTVHRTTKGSLLYKSEENM